MFDFVRDNTRLMLGLLVLLIIPSFVFFGIEGYKGFNGPENQKVASVAGQKV
ncbi:MAG: SurA N-terminal domain-containing protein, partial [Betaproteobacteria bacterium]